MSTPTKSQVITYIVFFILLAARISTSVVALIGSSFLDKGKLPALSWVRSAGPWLNASYMTGAAVLIAGVILLNQGNLQSLNIDRVFVFLFLYSGLAVFVEDFWGFGCLSGIVTIILVIYVLSSNHLKFAVTSAVPWQSSLLIIAGFVISLIAMSGFIDFQRVGQTIHLFFLETIPSTVYEEVIYRGLFWMLLRDLKWSEIKIFLCTALLFWISHVHYILDQPFLFWIFTPAVGLFLGYLVLRTKSLTPSAIAHLLINLLFGMISISL